MKFCGEGCVDACDFCTHYNFNGDDEGCYTGDGYCNLHKENSDPGDTCEDFHCSRAK